MIVFTSITLNYLPKARVLAKTIKKFHPKWEFHILINDRLANNNESSFEKENNPFFDKVIWLRDLNIDNIESWIFKHTVVELCTAVKGPYLWNLVNNGHKKIVYLDPDIAVFNSLSPIETLLDNNAILLTPHLLEYANDSQAIEDNEIAGTLRHGTFNLGFLAINAEKPNGRKFSEWWKDRLVEYCYADYDRGLFTDQKWCDLIPSFFTDYLIIRDPGYDVASWNLNKRIITFSDDGQLIVNDKFPLRFYHFTGYDSGAGEVMTERYKKGNEIIDEIWAWYFRKTVEFGQHKWGNYQCEYNFYENGKVISPKDRIAYRSNTDLQRQHPNPFKSKSKLF